MPACNFLLEDYKTDGFVGPLDVLSAEEAAQTWKEFKEWIAQHAKTNDNPDHLLVSGNARFKPHLYLPFANRIAHHPTLVSVVSQVLETNDIFLWSSDFNIKLENSLSWFPPHQDSTYAGLEPASKCVTAWVALSDPVTEIEGCLTFWKGSHLQGQLSHLEPKDSSGRDPNNMLSRGQCLNPELSLNESWAKISIPLRRGQATIHNFYTVHQSGPNHSQEPRVGLALRYIAAKHVRQKGPVRESVTVIHQCGPFDGDPGFDFEPSLPLINPSFHDIEEGKKAHREAMEREASNYFQGTDTKMYDEGERI